MIRRWASALLLLVVVAVTCVVALPAGAAKRDDVVLEPGQTVVRTYPALTGSNARQARTPAACSTKTACDAIPITLSVPQGAPPPDALLVEIAWKVRATRKVEAVGEASENQLHTSLWKVPADKTPEGVEIESTRQGFVAPPQRLSVFQPTLSMFLIVENIAGINEGYTVTFTYQEQGSGPGADGSQDESAAGPIDQSDDSGVAVTPSFTEDEGPAPAPSSRPGSAFRPPPSTGGAASGDLLSSTPFLGPAAIVLDVLSVRSDQSLDSIDPVDSQGNFRLTGAKRLARTSSGPPPPDDAPAALILFWLVVAPLAVALGLGAVVARRRSRALAFG